MSLGFNLDMEAALTHDFGILSAVFCALLVCYQLRWLEWPKTRDHWSNMLSLLERAYEMATHELTLLKVDNQEEKKVVKTKAVAARRLLRILRIRK